MNVIKLLKNGFLLLCVGLLFFFESYVVGKERPNVKGWRYPEDRDIILDWKEFKEMGPEPYYCAGDFNGDGLKDEAYLLFRVNGSGGGLFVFLSQKKGRPIIIQLDEVKNYPLQRLGISTVAPGEYQTACGKGYWTCKNGETPTIKLLTEAIDSFAFESANSFFYWDKKKKRFKEIWISD